MQSEAYHGIKSWMKYDVAVVGDGKRIAVDSQLGKQHRQCYCSLNMQSTSKNTPTGCARNEAIVYDCPRLQNA